MNKFHLITLFTCLSLQLPVFAIDDVFSEDAITQKYEALFGDDLDSMIKVGKQIRKDMKWIKSKSAPADTKSYIDMEVCVECDDMLKITKQINDIVSKLPEAQDPKSAASLEIDNLIAVSTLLEITKNNKTNCVDIQHDPNLSDDFTKISEEDLTLEFSQEFDEFFLGARFHRIADGHKTVWLRGTGDDLDKLIKIEISANEKKKVSYYTISNVDPNISVIKKKEKTDYNLPTLGVDSKITAPSFKEKTSGNLAYQSELSWTSDSGADYVKAVVGPDLEYKYYIPKKVKVLTVEAQNQFFDDYLVKSTVNVDTKSQEAEVSVVDMTDKSEVMKLKVDGSNTNLKVPYEQEVTEVYSVKGNVEVDSGNGETLRASLYNQADQQALFNVTARQDNINVGVPYEVDIYDSYNVTGVLSADTLGNQRYTASVRDGKSVLFNSEVTQSADGRETYSVGTTQSVAENGILSVKLQRTRDVVGSEDSVWVNYEMKF